MLAPHQELGNQGEDLARVFLSDLGYQILECNYRCKIGEIDIIAKHEEYLVFVEVKTRKGRGYIHPTASITMKKSKKLRQLGLFYIRQKKCFYLQPRFDVISILFPKDDSPIVEHFINAL